MCKESEVAEHKSMYLHIMHRRFCPKMLHWGYCLDLKISEYECIWFFILFLPSSHALALPFGTDIAEKFPKVFLITCCVKSQIYKWNLIIIFV